VWLRLDLATAAQHGPAVRDLRRAADGWDSPRFIGMFAASSYCPKHFSLQPPLTQTVGRLAIVIKAVEMFRICVP
jgi:hypothetical protein